MPHCSKCKQEKQDMKTAKTCIKCAESGKNYYHLHKEKQAETNKIWRATESGKEKQKSASYKWRQNNPERFKELTKKYYMRDSSKPFFRLNKAKQQAKSRDIPFLLTLEEYSLLIKDPCYYCNGAFGHVTKGTGLDRIDSSIGYIITNVISSCGICNRIKSNFFTLEETKAAVQAVLDLRNLTTSKL